MVDKIENFKTAVNYLIAVKWKSLVFLKFYDSMYVRNEIFCYRTKCVVVIELLNSV